MVLCPAIQRLGFGYGKRRQTSPQMALDALRAEIHAVDDAHGKSDSIGSASLSTPGMPSKS